MMLRKKLGRRC